MNRTQLKRSRSTIDDKISLAQQKLMKRKKSYETAIKRVERLLLRRNEMRKCELWKAVEASNHSYEEILNFIRG